MDPIDARARLKSLRSERFHALEQGVENPSPYLARLDAAIEQARVAYVTSAVIQIAELRCSLTGTPNG